MQKHMQYYILSIEHSISSTGWAITLLVSSCLLIYLWGDTNEQQREVNFLLSDELETQVIRDICRNWQQVSKPKVERTSTI